MEKIAVHCRVEPGKFSTHSYHIPAEKISNPEKGNRHLLRQADSLGGKTGAWARAMLEKRGVPGTRVLNGLLQLADKYTAAAIDNACGKALETSAFHLRELKNIIERVYQAEQAQFTFLDQHPLIRGMSEYGGMAKAALPPNLWEACGE
jgi:hypothetical protein